MAGANSIFYGEKLLTTANNDAEADRELIDRLGLKVQESQERPAHYDLESQPGSVEQIEKVRAAS
jgi:biotin synthase